MTTKRKIIIAIISVVVVILIASGAVAFLLLNQRDNQPDTQTGQPGDPVSLEQTPNYATCSMLPKDSVQAALGSVAASVSEGEREGTVARNYEIADTCAFGFTTSSSNNNSVTLQTYLYSADASFQEGSSYGGGSWTNITKQFYEDFQLEYPAYFQANTVSDVKEFILQVVTSAKNYRFAIEQPTDKTTYTDTEALTVLIALANKADYSVTDTSDAPPAPKV
jgi:flagellar basal body-associated protein FliL